MKILSGAAFLVSIALSLLLLSACEKEPPQGRAVLVLFDLSETVDGGERDEFRKYFGKILDAVKGGDSIMVVKIDESPAGGPILIADEHFEEYSPLENSRKQKAKTAASRRQLVDSVNTMLEEKAGSTPILDTLYMSQRLLDSSGASDRYIVLMSDMVEESRVANFTKRSLSEADIQSVIDSLGKNGRMPSFSGAKIYVAGARQKDIDRALKTRSFWQAYFEKAGAVFDQNKYGAELIAFP